MVSRNAGSRRMPPPSAPQRRLEVAALVELERALHLDRDGVRGGLQPPLQDAQPRPVLVGEGLEVGDHLALRADLRGEELGRRQVEEHGVDQIVGRQLLVQDQPRGVADPGHERAEGGEQRLPQLVAHHGPRPLELQTEDVGVTLDRGEPVRRIQAGPPVPGPLSRAWPGPPRSGRGFLAVLQRLTGRPRDGGLRLALDGAEERLDGGQVAQADGLPARDVQRLIDLREEEDGDEGQREPEEHADEKELPGVGQPVHEAGRRARRKRSPPGRRRRRARWSCVAASVAPHGRSDRAPVEGSFPSN